jgi:uncharacterized protein
LLNLAALLVLALAAGPLEAQPQVPPPSSLVIDGAGVMSADNERLLAEALAGFRQTQHREVSVVTVPDLQGYAIEDYTRAIRRTWGLDDSRNDDGAALLVAPNDMYVRIEVGSALKPILPDAVARDLVQAWVVPSFQRGDMDKGILDGAGAVMTHLELPPEQAAALAEQARLEEAQSQEPEGFPWRALAGLLLLVVLWSILRRAGGIFGLGLGVIGLLGRGVGFGGFGGGGGGFNGGGASGRW